MWGQLPLILFLTRLSVRWSRIEPARPFGIGDLAREDGRPTSDHVSHHTGVAVDIFPIRSDGLQRSMLVHKTTWADPAYDRPRNLELVRIIAELRSTFPMIEFLYNDPAARKLVPWITRFDEHDEHMHVLLTGQHSLAESEVSTMLRIAYTL